jgi:hypothetical protein
MTSRERPAGGRGPLQDLADKLERARLGAELDYPEMASRISNGPAGITYRKWVSKIANETYREMIGEQPPTAEALEAAASGSSLPSWAVTRAYVDACRTRLGPLDVFFQWNEAREASEAGFISRVLELRARVGPPRAGENGRLRDWGTVRRGTVIGVRERLEQRDAVYPGAVTGERGCPALAHPGTVEKILEACLDSRDSELFQELEAVKGRRWEARAAKESGRKEHRGWSDKPVAGLRMMPPNPAARGRASTRRRPAGLTFRGRTGA